MALKFLLFLVAACLASALSAVLVSENGKLEPANVEQKFVRAAYDDGLEIAEEDEEASARTHGLVDTLVRPAKSSVSSSANLVERPSLDISARAATFLGSASLEVLKELSARIEAGIKAQKTMSSHQKATRSMSDGAKSNANVVIDESVKTPSPEKSGVSAEAPSNNERASRSWPTKQGSDDLIQIGTKKVSKSRVSMLGDIDGNGFEDYAILSESEGQDAGAVRLYLMDANHAVKFQRHIIPGKWGFTENALAPGDRFGASILQVGDLNGDGVKDIAVGAPGDSESSGSKGAVYILLLKKDGSVLFNEKVSAERYSSLDRQLRDKEGFGSSLRILDDINGDKVGEMAVGSKDGSTTLVILSKTGHAHAGIKLLKTASMWNERSREPATLSERFMRMIKKERSHTLPSLSKAAASDCYFSDTHCQCEVAESGNAKCLDMVQTLANGQTMCEERACKESYRCSCEGSEYCSHSGITKAVYKLDAARTTGANREGAGQPGGGKQVECHAEEIQMEKIAVIPGARIPEMGSLSGTTAPGIWNSTHCSCSMKSTPGGECMQFDHEAAGKSMCTSRPCKTSEMTCDVEGSSTCTHKTTKQAVWLGDGKADAPPFHMCHEETKEKDVVECVSGCP